MPAAENRPGPRAPDGTVDTHMHIYGPPDRCPTAPSARVAAVAGASLEAYRRVMDRLNIARVVVVQPSTYGADNRCTTDAAAALGVRARAVVVVTPGAPDAERSRLTYLGAVGIRFFMLPGGALAWEWLRPTAARVHEHGWHVQLQLDGRDLEDRVPMRAASRGN